MIAEVHWAPRAINRPRTDLRLLRIRVRNPPVVRSTPQPDFDELLHCHGAETLDATIGDDEGDGSGEAKRIVQSQGWRKQDDLCL